MTDFRQNCDVAQSLLGSRRGERRVGERNPCKCRWCCFSKNHKNVCMFREEEHLVVSRNHSWKIYSSITRWDHKIIYWLWEWFLLSFWKVVISNLLSSGFCLKRKFLYWKISNKSISMSQSDTILHSDYSDHSSYNKARLWWLTDRTFWEIDCKNH